jgi:C4-dicarboxylate transporter DctM subunit
MLCGTALLMAWRNPSLGPNLGPVRWSERLKSLKGIWSVIFLMVCIMGAIYFGVCTPTEAAGFGLAITIVLCLLFFGLRWSGIKKASVESALITGMILFIMISGQIFTYVISSSELGQRLAEWIVSLSIPSTALVVVIMIIYLILGCFLDGLTIMLVTLPIFIPLLEAMNIDMIWFGVLFCTNMQLGLITPPFGVDLFITDNMFHLGLANLTRGVIPFLIVLIVFLFILVAFPQLSLFLPNMMMGG